MLQKPKLGLFVTGTDTGVGKTHVAAQIIESLCHAGHRVGVYKPVESGCERNGDQLVPADALKLLAASNVETHYSNVCPQRFEAALAPNVAAQHQGSRVDGKLLRAGLSFWSDRCDVVVIEGAGGLMSPVSDDDFVADLAFEFGYPLVVVAPNVLGTINQTVQTLIAAATFRDGLSVAGVVLNDRSETDYSAESNLQQIRKLCVPPVLGHVAWQGRLDSKVDWFELAKDNA